MHKELGSLRESWVPQVLLPWARPMWVMSLVNGDGGLMGGGGASRRAILIHIFPHPHSCPSLTLICTPAASHKTPLLPSIHLSLCLSISSRHWHTPFDPQTAPWLDQCKWWPVVVCQSSQPGCSSPAPFSLILSLWSLCVEGFGCNSTGPAPTGSHWSGRSYWGR